MKPHCKIRVFSVQLLIHFFFPCNTAVLFWFGFFAHCWFWLVGFVWVFVCPAFACLFWFCFVLDQAKPFVSENARHKPPMWTFNMHKLQKWWLRLDLLYTKEQLCSHAGKPPTEISSLYPYFCAQRFMVPGTNLRDLSRRTSFYSLFIFIHNETWDAVSYLHLSS